MRRSEKKKTHPQPLPVWRGVVTTVPTLPTQKEGAISTKRLKLKMINYGIPPPRFALPSVALGSAPLRGHRMTSSHSSKDPLRPLTQRDSQLQQNITAPANCPSKLGGRGAKLRRGYVKVPQDALKIEQSSQIRKILITPQYILLPSIQGGVRGRVRYLSQIRKILITLQYILLPSPVEG